jgi:hypothetical protein
LAVADLECGFLDRKAGDEKFHGLGQTDLAAPRFEADADFFAKGSLDCPDADAALGTERGRPLLRQTAKPLMITA